MRLDPSVYKGIIASEKRDSISHTANLRDFLFKPWLVGKVSTLGMRQRETLNLHTGPVVHNGLDSWRYWSKVELSGHYINK